MERSPRRPVRVAQESRTGRFYSGLPRLMATLQPHLRSLFFTPSLSVPCSFLEIKGKVQPWGWTEPTLCQCRRAQQQWEFHVGINVNQRFAAQFMNSGFCVV